MKKINIQLFLVFIFLFNLVHTVQIFSQPVLNDSFFDFCNKIVLQNEDPRVVTGIDSWFFFKPELIHISNRTFWGEKSLAVSKAKKPESADPLPAIVDFNNQLKEKGIELIFVPVPAKTIVYPEMLKNSVINENIKRLDYYHYEFYKILKAKGVMVLDILPLLIENRKTSSGPVYCKTDTHWSDLACELVAVRIGNELKKKKWYKQIPKLDLLAEDKSISITGDLIKTGEKTIKEEVKLRIIRSNNKDKKVITPSDKSPVILMGDSHTLVFHEGGDMYYEGAGLADQLAFELKFAVDLLGIRGSGSTASRVTLFRKSKYDPDYLSNKKVVIWCISVREFTESTQGWKIVPVSP